jgi:hypothetical protein
MGIVGYRSAAVSAASLSEETRTVESLIESWEASAQKIDERTAFGDPAVNIAAANMLRFCANRLRAALANPQPAQKPKAKRIDWSDVVVDEGDEAP